MTADHVSRPQGVGDISVVPSVVLSMSTIRARITASALALTAALALSACGAVGLLPQGDAPATPTTTTSIAPSTTRTPAAVPTLPTREPVPATEHIADAPDPLTAEVWVIAEDIDRFWETMTGRTFDADVRTVTGTAQCGATDGDLAVACFRNGAKPELRWSHGGVARLQREGTNVAVALLLGHEYGHIVLRETGNSTRDGREERVADCLAGVYLSVSNLDLGMTPSVLWEKAVPAFASSVPEDERGIVYDAIRLGFTAKDDPLAFCLANA